MEMQALVSIERCAERTSGVEKARWRPSCPSPLLNTSETAQITMTSMVGPVTSHRQSNASNFPFSAARLITPKRPPSTLNMMTMKARIAPPKRTTTWITSVQMTASMPPMTV